MFDFYINIKLSIWADFVSLEGMELNMKKIEELAKKFLTREIILYAVFGVLTTAVNIGSFYLMLTFLHIEENLANNIAIVLSVLFA